MIDRDLAFLRATAAPSIRERLLRVCDIAERSTWLIVIPCGSKKREGRRAAGELYNGCHFAAAQRWASSIEHATVRIFSAKYGLVASETLIESYDLKMGDPGSVGFLIVPHWATRVVSVCGEAYNDMLRKRCAMMGLQVECPVEGLGIGQRLRWFKEHPGKLS